MKFDEDLALIEASAKEDFAILEQKCMGVFNAFKEEVTFFEKWEFFLNDLEKENIKKVCILMRNLFVLHEFIRNKNRIFNLNRKINILSRFNR